MNERGEAQADPTPTLDEDTRETTQQARAAYYAAEAERMMQAQGAHPVQRQVDSFPVANRDDTGGNRGDDQATVDEAGADAIDVASQAPS